MPSRALRPALIGLVLWSVAAAAPPWPHEQSDLPPDPAVIWGRLDNGLRYVIRPNAEPKGRASLRLMVFAGVLHETDEQSGLAHFVEHMAFNGTRLYPKETLTGVLQKFGLASGSDANASTTMFSTFYKLEMPVTQHGRLAEGLQVLREFADGVTFAADEVVRERGVIESERLARNTEPERAGAALRKFLFAGHPMGERLPIGRPEVIREATPEKLRAFYDHWYRADNMLVVAVGDFDATTVEALVRARFASLATPAGPVPSVEFPVPANPPETVADYYRDNEAKGAVSVRMFSLTPVAGVDNRARRVASIPRRVAFYSLDLRLQSARLREGKKFGVMDTNLDTSSRYYQETVLRVDANGKRWRDAVNRAEQELRRARTHGFTEAEIKEVNTRMLAASEHGVRTAATRTSAGMADGLAAGILNHRVFVTPETSLELVREGLAAATPAACQEGFREAWGAGQPRIFVSGTLPGGIGAVQVAAAVRESLRKRVDPARETAANEFAYTDFGPPGTIAQRTHIDDLDIHCVEFANGVKLNLKSTDFSSDRILFSARFGTGWTGEPANRPGLRMVMGHGFTSLGLGRHKREALNHLSAGVIASFAVGLDEDAFTADGSTDGAGAARWMQLLTASLNDPGWHKEELPEIRQRIIFTFDQHAKDGTDLLAGYFYGQLTGQDPRFTWPKAKRVIGYSVAELRAWVEPQLKSGPLEIGIVGDFDVDEMIGLAAHTVGCLPPRGRPPPVSPVKFATVHNPKPLPVNGTIRSGAVQVGWALPAAHGHADLRRDDMLAETLKNRLVTRIREEMGATYAPACGVWRSEVQRDNAYLIAWLTCAPGDTQRVAEAIRQVADELARGSVSEEELERARQPQIQAVPAQMQNNAYWLHNAVLKAQSQPEVLDLLRTQLSDLEQMTSNDITALAAKVLPAANASLFTAIPAQPRKK